MTIDPPNRDGDGLRYAFKASLAGSAHRFELIDEGLSWQIGGRSAVWRYADINSIRLSYRPVWLQPHRFRCDIEGANQRLTVLSTNWQTATLMTAQDRDYRAFITQLHARMKRCRQQGDADRRYRNEDLRRGRNLAGVGRNFNRGPFHSCDRNQRICWCVVSGRLCRAVRLADRRICPPQPAAPLHVRSSAGRAAAVIAGPRNQAQ